MTDTWNYRTDLDPENVPVDYVWERLRIRRGRMLVESDWTQLPDSPVDVQAWATYRQTLRDLPSETKDPRKAEWPTKPE